MDALDLVLSSAAGACAAASLVARSSNALPS
jgi:hypothetical protein